MWMQKTLKLAARKRGFHLVTAEILQQLPEIGDINIGLLQVFIQHTSASLTLNENAAPDVRRDFEQFFNRTVPESASLYEHSDEGPDDMPAHLKASLLGSSLLLPISRGRLNLGTWQGIYLCEHRDYGGARNLVVTIHGE
jgi:secondary thiamine-phosphate synthase enzyme